MSGMTGMDGWMRDVADAAASLDKRNDRQMAARLMRLHRDMDIARLREQKGEAFDDPAYSFGANPYEQPAPIAPAPIAGGGDAVRGTDAWRYRQVCRLIDAGDSRLDDAVGDAYNMGAGVLDTFLDGLHVPVADVEAALSSTGACAPVVGDAWPSRFGCNGPEGSFWADDSELANKLISATFDRDEWTVTDTLGLSRASDVEKESDHA